MRIGGEGQVAMIHFDPFEPVRLRAVTARGAVRAERHGSGVHRGQPGGPHGLRQRPAGARPARQVPRGRASMRSGAAGMPPRWVPFRPRRRPGRERGARHRCRRHRTSPSAEVAKGVNWIATVAPGLGAIIAPRSPMSSMRYFAGTEPDDPNIFVAGCAASPRRTHSSLAPARRRPPLMPPSRGPGGGRSSVRRVRSVELARAAALGFDVGTTAVKAGLLWLDEDAAHADGRHARTRQHSTPARAG